MLKTELLFLTLTFSFAWSRAAPGLDGERCGESGDYCRAGRECVLSPQHPAGACVCLRQCPDHWKPVCGSDGKSYDNHCYLHKAACDTGKHISPRHLSNTDNVLSPCFSGDREEVLARQVFIEELSHWGSGEDEKEVLKKVPIPDACFENDRNRLREFLISWTSLSAKKQTWYTPGMTVGEELWGHFYTADIDRDLSVDTVELMKYLNRNKTEAGTHEDKNNKMRQLCLAELIQEGDNDNDDKLDFEEFRVIMQDEYQPSSQVCDFNGIKFSDGAERALECNGCVCACGKWICTSQICTEGYRDIESNDLDEEDEESPEDDPDVKDIRWF